MLKKVVTADISKQFYLIEKFKAGGLSDRRILPEMPRSWFAEISHLMYISSNVTTAASSFSACESRCQLLRLCTIVS